MFIENATVHTSPTGNNRLELNLSDVSDTDLTNDVIAWMPIPDYGDILEKEI